jgi:hypothetical protein
MTIPSKYLSANEVKAQIARLLTDCPELREDDEGLLLSLESETEATELCDRLVQNVEILDCLVETLKLRKKQIDERVSRIEFRQERMKQTIIEILQAAECKSLRLPSGTPVVGSSRHVVITEPEQIPEKFRRHPAWEPKKKEIAAALKAGEAVPGAMLSNPAPTLTIR